MAVVVGAVYAAPPSGALGPVDVIVTGSVKDPRGVPIAGARVADDRGQVTYANPLGGWSMREPPGAVVTWEANHPGHERRADDRTILLGSNRLIDDGTTVRFVLPYSLSGVVSPMYVSTSDGPATTTLHVTTHAPDPGVPGTDDESCVLVSDQRDGSVAHAVYQDTDPSGGHSWTHVVSLPQATPEGIYSLWFWAEDCASGLRLTDRGSRVYIVDDSSV